MAILTTASNYKQPQNNALQPTLYRFVPHFIPISPNTLSQELFQHLCHFAVEAPCTYISAIASLRARSLRKPRSSAEG